jgi:hypothetical protein
MTVKPWLMLAGTALAGAALAGCGPGGSSSTAAGSRTAGPSGHAAGSATPTRAPGPSGTSVTVPASAAAVAACTTSGLRVSVDGSASDSLGHAVGTELVLTNSSRHTCALVGYPGLQLLGSRHQVLPTATRQGGTFYANDPGRRPVELAPGQAARAALAWTAAGRSAVSASYLEVTPPGSATHVTISFRKLVDGGNLDVTAVARTVSLSLPGFSS